MEISTIVTLPACRKVVGVKTCHSAIYLWRLLATFTFVKRNVNAASAAVTKLFFFNISETVKASNFKIYHRIALDSLYIFTGNDVTIYILPVGSKSHKRIHFGSSLGHNFSIMVQSIPKKFAVLETVIPKASFPLIQPVRHFCSLTLKNGGSSGPTVVTRYVVG